MNKERTELNKGNVIEIRCKKCNKLMMEYFVCGDDSAVALQNMRNSSMTTVTDSDLIDVHSRQF